MDPGPLPQWERDPRTGRLVPARRYSSPRFLLGVLAGVLLLGAAVERSALLAGIGVALLVVVWGVPVLWRRWRAPRAGPSTDERD